MERIFIVVVSYRLHAHTHTDILDSNLQLFSWCQHCNLLTRFIISCLFAYSMHLNVHGTHFPSLSIRLIRSFTLSTIIEHCLTRRLFCWYDFTSTTMKVLNLPPKIYAIERHYPNRCTLYTDSGVVEPFQRSLHCKVLIWICKQQSKNFLHICLSSFLHTISVCVFVHMCVSYNTSCSISQIW